MIKISFISSSILIAVLTVPTNSFSRNDDTLKNHATGREVTQAVIRRIRASGIFPNDHGFLSRLAYVESRFGTVNNTFREEDFGGIWLVQESYFLETQSSNPNLTAIHQRIRDQFGIDWFQLNWNNLTVPVYSGLAAALYFVRVPEATPDTISGQANHWKRWYRPLGDVDRFIEDSEDLKNQTKCRGKMDLCLILDSSGSIGSVNYTTVKDFVAQFIESFTIDYNRIGMLVYSTQTRDIFPIENNLLISEMATQARSALYLNMGTRTDLAINRAITLFQDTTFIQGVPRLAFVFTDGNSDTGSTLPDAVQGMVVNNIKSVAVGIGNQINPAELKLIAQNDNSSVFQVSDFGALQDLLSEIVSVACETHQRPELGENGDVTDVVLEDEKRLYQFDLPPEGITVKVRSNKGNIQGYWSHTERVPSSAVYDGIIAVNESTVIPGSHVDEGSVYITIQGIDYSNNYTLSTEVGGWETSEPPPSTTILPSEPSEDPTSPSITPSTTTESGEDGTPYRCTLSKSWFLCLLAQR